MKLFVTSDLHSYLEPFVKALDAAGFDKTNEEHWLIVCGDAFDRGPDSKKLLHFLMSLERKILIKGNHDILLEDLCARGFPYRHDKSNGTVRTVEDIGYIYSGISFEECCTKTWNKTAAYRDLLVNYFETEHYIFVHSWIPTKTDYDYENPLPWHQFGKKHFYFEDWRNATESMWEEAMWGNPFKMAMSDLNKTGKTIVFGHWHCSAGYTLNDTDATGSEFGDNAIWEPYRNTEQGIIGIDRCTAHTGEVNVLVLEDDFID